LKVHFFWLRSNASVIWHFMPRMRRIGLATNARPILKSVTG
jgi:hypothetical protein